MVVPRNHGPLLMDVDMGRIERLKHPRGHASTPFFLFALQLPSTCLSLADALNEGIVRSFSSLP
jgi:hypothetical protein